MYIDPLKTQQVLLYFTLFILRSQWYSMAWISLDISGILLCSSSLQRAGPALWWNCKPCDTIWSLLADYSWVWLCRNTLSKFKLKIWKTLAITALYSFPVIYLLSEFGDLFMESRRFVLFFPRLGQRPAYFITQVTAMKVQSQGPWWSTSVCSPVLKHPRSP